MSILFTDMFIGEHTTYQKSMESSSSVLVICNILNFLDASPLTLFHGVSERGSADQERAFDDNFESFISCMIASDETVRRLAVGVARRLFSNASILKSARASKRLRTEEFKTNFWRLT